MQLHIEYSVYIIGLSTPICLDPINYRTGGYREKGYFYLPIYYSNNFQVCLPPFISFIVICFIIIELSRGLTVQLILLFSFSLILFFFHTTQDAEKGFYIRVWQRVLQYFPTLLHCKLHSIASQFAVSLFLCNLSIFFYLHQKPIGT